MGVPLLFTDTSGTPTLIVVPFPGLFLSDDLFLGDNVFLDDGPTLDFYATVPGFVEFGQTVSVDPVPVTFSGADAVLLPEGQDTVAVDPATVLFRGEDIATSGLPDVVATDPVPVVFGAEVPGTSGSQLLILIPSIRELPPLRLTHHLVTPSGRHFRWAPDDPNPTLVPSGERFGDTMPGGFETADCVLPRKPGTDYSDVERLSTWQILGAGSEVAWEGRLERAPRVSGDQMSVSPSAVGYQAALEDDKSVTATYIDRDLSQWRGAGATRQDALMDVNWVPNEPSSEADTQGQPALKLVVSGSWLAPRKPLAEAWYDAGPNTKIAGVWFTPSYSDINTSDANWSLFVHVFEQEGVVPITSSGNFVPLTSGGNEVPQQWFPFPARRFGLIQWYYNATPAGTDGADFVAWLKGVAVIGDHGLPVRTDGVTGGFFASDVVSHAVAKFAPLLNVEIQQSGFVIPHIAFRDRTTVAEIVRGATRFGLQDWAVWNGQDGPTFYWHDRGARGRKWRARVSPAQLEETGESMERSWESVIVQYQDVDGSSRTVGPPGAGADTTSTLLKDSDPENPANLAGIIRRDLLQMGTSTPAGATEVGRRFLEESRQFDKSGRARFVGHVEDDRGVLHPYWKPRAGDYVSFIDSNDTSLRRIVRTDKDHASRTCSVDLDAPPEGLQALLERLGVVLVPLGFN